MISFKNFSFKYSNLNEYTLTDISFEIRQGEKVLITGKSGSGKSTIAHCMNGLIPFNYKGELSGEILVDGAIPSEHSLFEMGGHVGTILQDQDCQFVGLSAGEDVAFGFENDCIPTEQMRKLVDEALEQVDMLEQKDITPQNLSGGQKQKVAIAGILAMKAPILLFDEPLANLDPASGQKAMETIDRLQKEGKTILVIEHRIEEVLEHHFDRVIVIEGGRIVFDGTPDEILAGGQLPQMGLRQPLYVEMLNLCGAELKPEDNISDLENTIKFKELVMSKYLSDTFEKKAGSQEKLLELKGICYTYYKEDPYTIKDITFDVKKGEMLAIVGNNGAGKSTLLKTISGIAKYQEGSMYYMGECIDKWSAGKRASAIGFVMQNPNHMITKNIIFDEVAFGPRNFGIPAEEVKTRAENALKTCGLYAFRNWPASALSYGQKKRLTIASILAMGPKVIILDEPTAGQDYTSYREFMNYLSRIRESGTAIILITHDMHLALEYADRAVVLSGGTVIAQDTMDKVLSDSSLVERANLKHTSIESMGRLYGVSDLSGFIAYFTRRVTGGGIHD
ncbi:ATP-binding cassette domain-containing protein [Aminipila luticellarii]|uniref:ATP-binding cassette domain-containing protein n=2 Tax=Aminipila luticellarii TaxID=2507160 RepID=A0A410PYV9_9FIRM|nr:ATP-binding cassette domain-containing protein [Aminipila luticellarii]